MIIPFTKMQGIGNDFVVINETTTSYNLQLKHYKFLCDRHFGVGSDQVLTVRTSATPDIDFIYLINNADGTEVAQCGNGARCFARYVVEKKLTSKREISVQTTSGVIVLKLLDNGWVAVNMGAPIFDTERIPFIPKNVLPDGRYAIAAFSDTENKPLPFFVLSMGNPHAVLLVDDIQTAAVLELGQALQNHKDFPERVNVGFFQVLSNTAISLRVYERGAGETLACGTGACAAVICGIQLGLLSELVQVTTSGGTLEIMWQGIGHPVFLTGPAVTVFEGTIELPNNV
jgi:diaminopimelate epimerase